MVPPPHCQVQLTAPSAEEAERLGRMAVERRLAACAQVSGPVSSTAPRSEAARIYVALWEEVSRRMQAGSRAGATASAATAVQGQSPTPARP